MFTAKDMYEVLKDKESNKGDIIDSWLQEVVLPKHSLTGYNSSYNCPKGVSLCEAESLLKARGFSVTTFGGYQGDFITLTLPPQGD
jgi:hypothetical protein